MKFNLKKVLFFLLILIFLFLISTVFFKEDESQEIYVDIGSRTYFSYDIMSTHSVKDDLFDDIFFNDAPLVYSIDNDTYFYSINKDNPTFLNDIDIEFSSDYEINYTIVNSDYNKNYNYSINPQNDITILVFNSLYYKEVHVSFTYLPILNINIDDNITNEKKSANLYVYDPYYVDYNGNYYNNFMIDIRTRGSLSSFYPKKSYKIIYKKSIIDKVSLLGMAENNEWILDSLYSDPSKVRNMLSSQIWNDIIDNETNSEIRNYLKCNYVELFVNGSYRGLYIFKEQLNENNLNLDKKILIKGNGYKIMSFDFNTITSIFSDEYINFEMKYPSSKENSFCFWYFILNRMKNYYSMGYVNDNIMSSTFLFDNISDYKLLLAFTKAVDNNSTKNIYVEYNYLTDKLVFIPWDLDQTFGMSWTDKNDDTYMIYKFDMYNELGVSVYESFSPSFNYKLRKKYFKLRSSILNIENVNNYLNEYQSLLVESGAAKRDSERWYNFDIQYEFDCIRDWTKNRINFLDDYFDYKS